MSNLWDSVVAGATKAATQAGEATQVAAAKAKLHADLLVVDRDIHARKEKFGVDMYAHLESITGTQEFYVADDRLIEIIRPTLIKAQREVAAYERKRDAMKGKVNLAEANRSGTASIFGAASIGEKLMNAAKYAAAGAKEAASKTELAMLERQILGFKEEFGVELYPIFESMEDNEGWLPTDRKVRSLYDGAREDIAQMNKSKEEKREEIKKLDGLEGSGLTPPTIPAATPTVVATPVDTFSQSAASGGATPWASAAPTASAPVVGNGYGSSQAPPAVPTSSYGGMDQMKQMPPQQQPQPAASTGFDFMTHTQQPKDVMQQQPQYTKNPASQPPAQPQQNMGAVFDPFDGIGTSASNAGSSFSASSFNATPSPAPAASNAFNPFSGGNAQQQNGGGNLSNADMNLFKY
ncbi:hypothetical protein ACHAXT_007118 [Thalassiosira profunda]